MKLTPCKSIIREQKGQALLIVLILILLAGLIIGPLLAFMSTGLKVTKVHEKKMHEFYAADAGIEDALWHLQSDERLKKLIQEVDPTYDPPNGWTPADYDDWPLPPYYLVVNRMDVNVTIDRVWLLDILPTSLGLPDSEPAKGSDENANDHWTVIGAINYEAPNNYIVDITTDESARVDHIGDSVKINGVASDDPSLISYRGGWTLIWDFSGTTFKQLSDITPLPPGGHPPAEKFPPSVRLSFDYTVTPFKEAKGFFFWIKLGDGRIAWDTEAGVYHIKSLATEPGATEGTTVETYTPRAVRRYTSGSGGTSSAIKGDYIVIGNSLMTCYWEQTGCCGTNPSRNYAPVPVEFPITDYPDAERESSAQINVGGVPADAKIERAYLYWTAWLRGDWLWGEYDAEIEDELGKDWVGWQWEDYMGWDDYWEANAPDEVKEWLAANAFDGTAYLEVNGQKVTPTIAGDPAGTVFVGEHDSKYYGKVYISEGSSDVQPSYQYACFADVTDQVKAIRTAVPGAKFTVAGVHAHPAESCSSRNTWNNSANAGWSMIIIYSSEDKETHQIYLYEGCNHIWGEPSPPVEFTIADFETPPEEEGDNEARITVFASEGDEFGGDNEYLRFKGEDTDYYDLYDMSNTKKVFNSRSSTSGFTPLPEDMPGQPQDRISGVDIDTYTCTQPSCGIPLSTIVHEYDTSANIKVRSDGDGFMLIYVVFSVRSTKVPAGAEFEVGIMTYEIK